MLSIWTWSTSGTKRTVTFFQMIFINRDLYSNSRYRSIRLFGRVHSSRHFEIDQRIQRADLVYLNLEHPRRYQSGLFELQYCHYCSRYSYLHGSAPYYLFEISQKARFDVKLFVYRVLWYPRRTSLLNTIFQTKPAIIPFLRSSSTIISTLTNNNFLLAAIGTCKLNSNTMTMVYGTLLIITIGPRCLIAKWTSAQRLPKLERTLSPWNSLTTVASVLAFVSISEWCILLGIFLIYPQGSFVPKEYIESIRFWIKASQATDAFKMDLDFPPNRVLSLTTEWQQVRILYELKWIRMRQI